MVGKGDELGSHGDSHQLRMKRNNLRMKVVTVTFCVRNHFGFLI